MPETYLNTNFYGEALVNGGQIILKEKVFGQRGNKPNEYRVSLVTPGETLVIRLDSKKNGSSPPLFHFLDDTAKPWSKRCDFVVFNLRGGRVYAYCFEFKSESIPYDVTDQLKASVDWLKSLHATINAYTTKRGRIHVLKFVLSNHSNPADYLEEDGKYLKRDHTIRHYRYAEIDGMALADLENTNVERIV